MKISTEIGSIANIVGERRAVELCAKAGFDAWDFSMFKMCKSNLRNQTVFSTDHPLSGKGYAEFAKELRKIADDNGIVCNQSHAPFPSVASPEMYDYFKRSFECTAIAGGDTCIIHPDNYKTPEENGKMFKILLPYAKEWGVKIAVENMWNWDREKDEALPAACSEPVSFNAHLDAVDDPFFVACLDIGHAEMRGVGTNAVDMIHALGSRLGALHIHDNDRHYDSHQIPFSMNIDFDAIVRALKDIDYKGWFTLEADAYLGKFNAENVFQGVCDMQRAAKKLANMFEAL